MTWWLSRITHWSMGYPAQRLGPVSRTGKWAERSWPKTRNHKVKPRVKQLEIGISICPGIMTWNQKPTRRNCNHRAEWRGGSENITQMYERMHWGSTLETCSWAMADVLWLMGPNCRDPDLLLQKKVLSQISRFFLKNVANKPVFYPPKLSGCWERWKLFSQYHTCFGRSIDSLQLCCSQSIKFQRNYIHLTLNFVLKCNFQIS